MQCNLSRCTMSEDSTRKHRGGLSATRSYDPFTWRIPNISSVPHKVDYCIQSPPFTFDGANFILKMYPYGQTTYGSEGHIDVALERVSFQVAKQNIYFQMICTDVFGKKVKSVDNNYLYTSPICTQYRKPNFMEILKDSSEKWRIAPNDTFTLVCALGKDTSNINQEDFEAKTRAQNASERCRTSRNYGNSEIGVIVKEYSHFNHFFFKICKITEVPVGYCIREQISFANAVWIVKIYPYFRMENSSKPYFDVVLERFQSEVPEHNINFEIAVHDPLTHISVVERSFIFNAYQTLGEVITFQLKEESKTGCLHFDVTIRNKWNNEHETNSSSQLNGQATDDGSSTLLKSHKVLQDFKKLLLEQDDCDFTINVKGQEFKAHKIILKSRSPVLASAFRNDMQEKATSTINIKDCDPSSFSDFLHFLYCGEVENLSDENVFNLFIIADKYDVQDLRNMCMEFMKLNLTVDTFCDTVALALQYSETELIELCTAFFARNLQEIILTVKWQSFITENPIQGNELMIKALVPSNFQRSGGSGKQTQCDRQPQMQNHKHKSTPQQVQQDRDARRQIQRDRGTQRESQRNIDSQRQTSGNREAPQNFTAKNDENKLCAIM